MALDCGKKVEYPEITCKLHTGMPQLPGGFKPRIQPLPHSATLKIYNHKYFSPLAIQ